jgi:predicted house-cleaning noncanonical NTP pyrophosphatase (MazG superfamily)
MADVEEVILALYEHIWRTKQEVEEIRLQKLQKNGGFEKGYILKTS